MDKEISLIVKCPLCGKSLMDEGKLFRNKAAVKLNIETEHDRGVLWLSSIFGDTSKEMSIEVAHNEIVDIYCSHCNKELSIEESCTECGGPMVSFVIKAGGIVRICSRNDCAHHTIVFKDVASEMSKFYYEYGF